MPRRFPLACLLVFSFLPALRAESVLVLPFFNLSPPEADVDWIGESISESVREALYARGFLVLSRDDQQEACRRLSVRPYARLTRATVIKVAEALDAGVVVYGQFELLPEASPTAASRGSLRITVRVLDMKRLRQAPESTETGALDEMVRLQTRVAWRALQFLDPKGAPSEEELFQQIPPVRLDAMESYIRGLLARTTDQRHRFFTQAVRLDDNFSRPSFELGKLYWAKKDYRIAASWLARVKPGSPHSLESAFFLGLCRYYTAEYEAARKAFDLVSRSLPLSEVFNNLGAAQSRARSPEALENFRKALEGDPTDPDYHFNVGYAAWKKGAFAEAVEHFRAVLDRNPDDAMTTLLLGRALKGSGPRPGDAQADGLDRVKHNFEERAYRELKAALEGAKP